MLITKDRVYLSIIVAILIIFFFREGCTQRQTDKLVSDIANYKTEAKHYTDKFGDVIATNQALNLTTQSQIKSLLASNDTMKAWIEKFKTIKAGIVIHEKTIIKEVAVPFDRNIPCDFKPFTAFKLNKDYKFYSTIANTGLTIDSLIIPNTSSIIVGDKKSGFLGMNKELTIEVKNSNTLMQTSNIAAYTYTPNKKFYEKTWFHLTVGATIGGIAGVKGYKYLNNK